MLNRLVSQVFGATLAVAGAVSLVLVSQGVASAGTPPIQLQNCDDTPNRHFDHQGPCVTAVETYVIQHGNNRAVGMCDLYFAGIGGEVPGGPYDTTGDCVTGLKELSY